MAAGALSITRGVAGLRTTKGLFFILTLLCLVCLSSSLKNTEKLEKAKKMLKNLQQKLDRQKEEYESNQAFSSELMNEYIRFIDPVIAIFKKRAPDFPPLLELMENLKTFMKNSKSYIDKGDDKIAAKFKSYEKKVREMKQLIEYLEGNQYEL